MNNYTTIEQSKKLIELGLDPKTADMYYEQEIGRKTDMPYYAVKVGKSLAIEQNLFSFRNGYEIPCWSLGALIDLMPLNILDKENVLQPRQIVGNDVYYDNICYFNNIYGLFNNVVECILWLLKNEYIEKRTIGDESKE